MHTPGSHPPRTGAVTVRDQALLGRLIKETVGKRWPWQERAARALGIHRGHYSRLLHGKAGKTITLDLYRALRHSVPVHRWPELRRAVFTPEAEKVLREHRQWLARELRRFGCARWVYLESDWFDPTKDVPLSFNPSRKARRHGQACEEVLAMLRAVPSCESQLDAFQRWAAKRGWDTGGSARYQLALLRAVEPLAAIMGSLVEYGPIDLEAHRGERQLVRYLKAALERERVLLDRLPDSQEAQRIGAMLAERRAKRR